VTTKENVTKRQIRVLREQAEDAGDWRLVDVCDVALSDGLLWGCRTSEQSEAIAACAQVIADDEMRLELIMAKEHEIQRRAS